MSERLTRRMSDGTAVFAEKSKSFYSAQIYEEAREKNRQILDRLCEIEDKIEQGKIVELPCEIGQTVYKVTYPYRAEPKVTEFIVCGFNYCRNAKHKMIMNLHLALKANRKLKHTAKLKDIYFTPEEANKMLKELENEETDK